MFGHGRMVFQRVASFLCTAFFLYPIFAIASVYVCWIMHDLFGLRGAILGSLSTPMGFVFNVSAILTVGFPLWVPVGFVASFFVTGQSVTKSGGKHRYLPIYYVAFCLFAVLLVLTDPGHVFELYFD